MRSLVNTLMNFMFIILHYYVNVELESSVTGGYGRVEVVQHPRTERELDGGQI